MIPIFIVSNREYSGKTFLAIGLARKFSEQNRAVGYIKPFGKSPVKKGLEVFDADAVFIKESLSLPDPLPVISPFVLSHEVQHQLLEGRIRDVKKRIMDAIATLEGKDVLIIGGAGDLFEGASLGIHALSLIEELDALVLFVESWRGETSMDTLLGVSQLIGKRFLGGVINKVPSQALRHISETVKPFLEKRGIKIFGVFERDSLLESVTVRQLNEILNGRVLCREDRLDEVIEHFSVGAMDVDNALTYFRKTPNKAVITGSHRTEIQLAAMETSTKCIILTGGLHTNDVIIGKAVLKGVPIISVTDDTFLTIEKIESVLGKVGIREERKVARVMELMKGFDYERLAEAAKV